MGRDIAHDIFIENKNDYLDNLTIVTSTRDNIIWVEPFLKSFYQTVFNRDILIIIVDASSEENYKILLNIVLKYKNVKIVISPSEIKHWTSDWEYGIKQCTTKYILLCHIDIIFLYKNWDIILPELLQTYVVVAGEASNNIGSSFLLTTTSLLSNVDCRTGPDHNNITRELGSIIKIANERGKTLLFKCNALGSINQIQFGDISTLEDNDIYYHSYYSSRIYANTSEPIPKDEFISSNIEQRNLNEVPFILLKYLDSEICFRDFLLNM